LSIVNYQLSIKRALGFTNIVPEIKKSRKRYHFDNKSYQNGNFSCTTLAHKLLLRPEILTGACAIKTKKMRFLHTERPIINLNPEDKKPIFLSSFSINH
jgi:hypothetical protein